MVKQRSISRLRFPGIAIFSPELYKPASPKWLSLFDLY